MRRIMLFAGIVLLAPMMIFANPGARCGAKISADQSARQSLDAFNQKIVSACERMDHPASAALWAKDGVDLIQGLQPMTGKTVITNWLNSLTPQLRGAKMLYCTIDWREVKIHGDWAYEWGVNRQKIEFPPPQKAFENEGKIVYILKRENDGSWKIKLESWNSNPQTRNK